MASKREIKIKKGFVAAYAIFAFAALITGLIVAVRAQVIADTSSNVCTGRGSSSYYHRVGLTSGETARYVGYRKGAVAFEGENLKIVISGEELQQGAVRFGGNVCNKGSTTYTAGWRCDFENALSGIQLLFQQDQSKKVEFVFSDLLPGECFDFQPQDMSVSYYNQGVAFARNSLFRDPGSGGELRICSLFACNINAFTVQEMMDQGGSAPPSSATSPAASPSTPCTQDTDGGDVPNTLGKIMNGSTEVVRDYCGTDKNGNRVLAEYMCDGVVYKKYYKCPNCAAGVCEPSAAVTPTPLATQTPTSTTTSSVCTTGTVNVAPGLSAVNFDQVLDVQPFYDAGITLYDFSFLGEVNSRGDRRWRIDGGPGASYTTEAIVNLTYGVGYYLYNQTNQTIPVCKKSGGAAQTKYLRCGWNFLSNQSGSARRLSDFSYRVVNDCNNNTCTSANCSTVQTLRQLLTGTAETRRLFTTIPLVINPRATDNSAFRYDRITASNADAYAIPGRTDYWVFLFPPV